MAAPNKLSQLILDRMAERGLTYGGVSKRAKERGHTISRSSVFALANNYDRHHAPYTRTLKALAAGLDYPFDVVAQAAAESAGYTLKEVTTTLASAGSLRIIAAVHEELAPAQQLELARMAEKYAAELKAVVSERTRRESC